MLYTWIANLLSTDERDTARVSMNTIIAIGLGIILLSVVLPVAFDNFFNVSTANWDSGTAALWVLIPLVVVIGIVVAFVPRGGRGL